MIYEPNKEKELLADILSKADHCLIYSGAGMGADSGLAVFRGAEGLWERYPEAKELGFSFRDLANPYNYLKHPEVVVPFYLDRLKSYQTTKPHKGFSELLRFVQNLRGGYFAVTSNVDGHFQKAGFRPDRVSEIHGSINTWQCSRFQCAFEKGEKGFIDISKKDTSNYETLRCKHCGARLRPNLLMFDDMDFIGDIYQEQHIRYSNYLYSLLERSKGRVAVIEVGAGSELRSIRSIAETAAYDLKTKLIRINPMELEQTEQNDPDIINIKKTGLDGIGYIMDIAHEVGIATA